MTTKPTKAMKAETPVYTYNNMKFANHVEFSAYLLSRKVFNVMDDAAVLTAVKDYVASTYPDDEELRFNVGSKMLTFISDKKNNLIASFMKL